MIHRCRRPAFVRNRSRLLAFLESTEELRLRWSSDRLGLGSHRSCMRRRELRAHFLVLAVFGGFSMCRRSWHGVSDTEGGSRADCKPGSVGVSSLLACEYETTSNDTA